MKVHILFYIIFNVLKVLYIIFYNTVTSSFSSHCFTSAFTSADVMFHNFIQHYLKQDFFMNVPFIKGLTQPTPPSPYHPFTTFNANDKNLLSLL